MKKIFKYKLDKINTKGHMILEIPMPAEILSVVALHNEAVVYTVVDDEDQTTPVDILAVETDSMIKDNIDTYKFLGTVVLDGGGYVIHIFYRYIDVIGSGGYIISETIKESAGKMLQETGIKGEKLMV